MTDGLAIGTMNFEFRLAGKKRGFRCKMASNTTPRRQAHAGDFVPGLGAPREVQDIERRRGIDSIHAECVLRIVDLADDDAGIFVRRQVPGDLFDAVNDTNIEL